MKYCTRCITPHNRPNIRFDEDGRCNCATQEVKRAVDWDDRRRQWEALVEEARARGAEYDCVIPVSGGKDSTWQTLTCLEAGLRPLCVTWRTARRTPIGEANLRNLVDLGVDHIDVTVNPQVEKRFMVRALERFGSPAVPMHMALFAIPLRTAVRIGAPLVVWGENTAFEYGGEEEDRYGLDMTESWLLRYGVTFGTTARDWVGDGLSKRDLSPYQWPTDAEMQSAGVRAVFLGAYFNWDPREVYEVARRHGFRADDAPRTGYYAYADIDDDFISIHHWLKWYKFGFTRAFDNLSLEVRAGRMTRDEAITALRDMGDQTPHEDIDRFCEYVGITRERFFEIVERFRNHEIWECKSGCWRIPEFIVPDWEWAR